MDGYRYPKVGDDVYYVAPGSADGKYPKAFRAAKITEVGDPDDPFGAVNLFVMNPQGIHFPLGVPRDDTKERGYSWHYPDPD